MKQHTFSLMIESAPAEFVIQVSLFYTNTKYSFEVLYSDWSVVHSVNDAVNVNN